MLDKAPLESKGSLGNSPEAAHGGSKRMGQTATDSPSSMRKRGRIVAAIVAFAVVVAVSFVGYSIWNGDIAPSDSAAKYSGFNYLPESDVTSYIDLYRTQMQLSDSSDEDWATFLAAYNLTPQRLRYSTIQQLIKDDLVQKKANELGIAASEEEVDAAVDTLRNTLALGDEKILQLTLDARGQTLEGLREVYRKAIVKRLVLSEEVETPTSSDEQVKDYLKSFTSTLADPTVRHTYYFKLNGVAESGDRDKIDQIEQIRKQFLNGPHTAQAFEELVEAHCNDEGLVSTGGANGWDVDASELSNSYLGVLEGMSKGDVSDSFRDGERYGFIWVDDEYTLPVGSAAIDDLDVSSMPESLREYFNDAAAYKLWELKGEDYLEQLLEEANVVYYPMPEDVPYNVDMSLADVQLEEVETSG